jgi:hypothetical protein
MTLLATPALVRSKVADVLRLDPSARVVALLASPSWTYDDHVDLPGGRRAVVRGCVSPLAIREALANLDDVPGTDVLVLLTEQDSTALGDSVTARLAGHRVLPLDRWQQLMSLFRARAIDPLLTRSAWAVDALLAHAPSDGYPAAPNGYLDKETAFTELSARVAGLGPLDLDLAGLLQWTLDPAHIERWQALDASVRDGLVDWLSSRSQDDRVIDAVVTCMGGAYGKDTVAVGLVLAALTQKTVRDHASVPRTMLETRALNKALDPDVGQAWGRAAEALVQRSVAADRHETTVGRVLRRAEEILSELNAVEFAHASGVLDIGLSQRIVRVGAEITRLLRKRTLSTPHLGPLEKALEDVHKHALVNQHEGRVRRAHMAVRLVRWIARQRTDPPQPAQDLAEAARRQQEDDAWVDVARARVWEGDVHAEVAAAYRALCATVDEIRAGHESRFAKLLADYTRTGSTQKGVLPVEHVLDDVVVPLVSTQRVLLLVLDAMSTGVARELLEGITGRGWVEHGLDPVRPVIAALPSITRVSRTSLLTGRLIDGSAATEKAAFAERGWPLFHKADLTAVGAGDALSPTVIQAIKSGKRIVGVVVNTVDDALDNGGRAPWTVDSIDRLGDLLSAAIDADRVVLLVSDHGHVHERSSRLEPDESGGARFRTSPRPPGADEVELTGPRVLLGGGRIVAPWNENLRYTKKHNGYHGGASAQEVVIPLVLLARAPLDLPGWRTRHHPEPDWWVGAVPTVDGAPARSTSATRSNDRKATTPDEEESALFATREIASDSWIDRALASDVFVDQMKRIRRGAMPVDRLALLLRTLDAHGGVATRATVARALDIPLGRVANHITAAQRILNLDGYEVLRMEGESVLLNAKLLKTQAGLT